MIAEAHPEAEGKRAQDSEQCAMPDIDLLVTTNEELLFYALEHILELLDTLCAALDLPEDKDTEVLRSCLLARAEAIRDERHYADG